MVTLTGGVDYLRYGMKAWGGVAAAKDGLYSNLGLFLIAKMRFFDDKLILSAAGRFDSFKMDVADLGVSKKETHFAPSVGVAFLPFEWLKLRANYANAFSMPTSDQLGADTVTGYGPTVGDPTLEPSESDTWEFGVDVMNEHANVSATYFYTKTDNYINFFYDMNVYVSTWRNLHVGYRSGVELYASADLAGMAGQNFELRPYFSMTHMFKFTGKETADDPYIPITGIPETVYGAGLRFSQADAGIAANVSVNKISNLNRLSPTSVNLSVIKRLFRVADYGEIYAKLVVDNFTDETIEYTDGYVQPGRTIYLGVGYEY
jgi:vitamin B12 transporter